VVLAVLDHLGQRLQFIIFIFIIHNLNNLNKFIK
jgi:hypothetical protein